MDGHEFGQELEKLERITSRTVGTHDSPAALRVRLEGRSSSPEAAAFGVVEAPLARDVEAAVHGRFLWSASKVTRGSATLCGRLVAERVARGHCDMLQS